MDDSRAAAEPGGVEITATSPANVLYLDSQLQIRNVEAVHRTLLEYLAANSDVIVDTGRVTAIDTAGVQLLLALANEARVGGRRFTLRGESGAIRAAFSSLGLHWPIEVRTDHAS